MVLGVCQICGEKLHTKMDVANHKRFGFPIYRFKRGQTIDIGRITDTRFVHRTHLLEYYLQSKRVKSGWYAAYAIEALQKLSEKKRLVCSA